jgi:hypothetical protein
MLTDGRTDMTKLIVAFSNFANTPINVRSILKNFRGGGRRDVQGNCSIATLVITAESFLPVILSFALIAGLKPINSLVHITCCLLSVVQRVNKFPSF